MENKLSQQSPIICLMGPTASGKTPLAIELVQHFPCEIISVDSAMIYRGMNIGTAKPDPAILKLAPHRLIDILDPAEIYSAGQFCQDALREIDAILAQGKIPLLVGGTMLYFRVLQQGIAALPRADAKIRAEITARARLEGWEALHFFLATIDPDSAMRIHKNDSQRIQRALEIYFLTGKSLTAWQKEETNPLQNYHVINLALLPSDRALLHEKIAKRFQSMLQLGLVDEVEYLYARGDLSPDLPSMRSVGYRQVWAYLAGELSFTEMQEQAIAATRQLAKRQMTWLRTWSHVIAFAAESKQLFVDVQAMIKKLI